MAGLEDERLTCGVCGRKRSPDKCHIIQLTKAERQALAQDDFEPPQQCVYCKPCWRTLSNRATAPELMKGLHMLRLRAIGVPQQEAEIRAEEYYKQLLAHIPEETPS